MPSTFHTGQVRARPQPAPDCWQRFEILNLNYEFEIGIRLIIGHNRSFSASRGCCAPFPWSWQSLIDRSSIVAIATAMDSHYNRTRAQLFYAIEHLFGVRATVRMCWCLRLSCSIWVRMRTWTLLHGRACKTRATPNKRLRMAVMLSYPRDKRAL